VVADGLSFPNGMVITPDGKTLIVAETMGHRLTAFDILADGALANRRVYAQLAADVSPDGITLDAEGGVWVANPEGRHAVLRVLEGGEVAEAVELDTDAYAVMLGGPQRRHLLICASDSHNPAEIARSPSATLRLVEVAVAGAGTP
jgi:sugar lactone lactonase YvrE